LAGTAQKGTHTMIIDRLFSRRDTELVNPMHPKDPGIASLFGLGQSTVAGQVVNPDTAMRISTVFACVRGISETLAHLPLKIFERLSDDTSREAKEHRWYRPLHAQPNGWQSSMEYREMGTAAMCLQGVHYARIVSRGDGVPQLLPLTPGRVQVDQRKDLSLVYKYYDPNGQSVVLLQEEVLRVPFMVLDGIVPLSPIAAQREMLGGALAAMDYANRFYQNDLTSSFWIEHPAHFEDDADLKRFRRTFKASYSGEFQRSPVILEDGLKIHPLAMNHEDAQWIESRKFSREEILAIYRYPPHMAQNLDRATNNNIEHQSLEFVIYTMGPWIVRWEQAMRRDLLREDEQDRFFFEFNVMGLLRGDVKTRYAAYSLGRQWGWLSVNDILRKENSNTLGPRGDVYLQPLNMVPAGADAVDDDEDQIEEDSQNGRGETASAA